MLLALVVALGVLVPLASGAHADTVFGFTTDHLTVPAMTDGEALYTHVTVRVDPGYAIDPYQGASDWQSAGGHGSLSLGDCSPAAGGGSTCTMWLAFYGPTVPGPDQITIYECMTGLTSCDVSQYAALHLTIGPVASRMASALPGPIDFGSVPLGTTVSRDIPLRPDPGYAVTVLGSGESDTGFLHGPNYPYDIDFGACVLPTSVDCTPRLTFTPTEVGERDGEQAYNAEECTGTIPLCIYHFGPMELTGQGVSSLATTPSSLTLPDLPTTSLGHAFVRLTLDAGYEYSSTQWVWPGGSEPLALGTHDCSAGDAPPCMVELDWRSLSSGTPAASTLRIRECRPGTTLCQTTDLPVTIGPAMARMPSNLPASVDFGVVPVGTSVSRSIPVDLDPGDALPLAFGGNSGPWHFSFASCDHLARHDCAVEESFTPVAPGTVHDAVGVEECSPGDPRVEHVVCIEDNLTPIALTGTGVRCAAMTGAVNVGPGQVVCLTGSHTGPVTVARGGSLLLNRAHLLGSINATGPAALEICGSQVTGGITVTAATGPVVIGSAQPGCPGNHLTGPVNVRNDTGPTTIGANNILGALACSANSPLPTDDGVRNLVTGLRSGQCVAPF